MDEGAELGGWSDVDVVNVNINICHVNVKFFSIEEIKNYLRVFTLRLCCVDARVDLNLNVL